jgi:tetratricopeptide (TPR) repeat protein
MKKWGWLVLVILIIVCVVGYRVIIGSRDSNYYNNRGMGYMLKADMSKSDYDNAIQDFSKVIELDPNDEIGYANRGNAYLRKKDYDKAIQDYNIAIKMIPNDFELYNQRGNAYKAKGEYDKAIQDLKYAIKLDNEQGDNSRKSKDFWEITVKQHRNDLEEAIKAKNKRNDIKPFGKSFPERT